MGGLTRRASQRWRRVFALRRAFTEAIVSAGMRETAEGKRPWVVLTDALDDTIFAALAKEVLLAERQWKRRRR